VILPALCALWTPRHIVSCSHVDHDKLKDVLSCHFAYERARAFRSAVVAQLTVIVLIVWALSRKCSSSAGERARGDAWWHQPRSLLSWDMSCERKQALTRDVRPAARVESLRLLYAVLSYQETLQPKSFAAIAAEMRGTTGLLSPGANLISPKPRSG
jgi:hypothetical protein